MCNKFFPIKVVFSILLFLTADPGLAQTDFHAEKLISQLGCGNCHTSLKIESNVREKLPDLSYAGMRYNPAYLFDFLQNPTKIRKHIGFAKMPNFRFNKKETLALVLFLQTQNQVDESWPEYPSEITNPKKRQAGSFLENQSKVFALEDSVCFGCHSLNGKGGVFAVDLATVSYRLQADWVKRYLAAPALFKVPSITMPEVFYQLSRDKTRFIKKFADAGEQILYLIEHLFSFNQRKKEQLEQAYKKVKEANPQINAELGERIFRSQNCTACHPHRTIKPPPDEFAPDLRLEGFRVHEDWLKTFLKQPYPIRPFGYQPGSGSRMPDFELSDGMIQTLTTFLMNQTPDLKARLTAYLPQKLTAFSMQKAQILLQDKFSCSGCHRIGEQGGKIGPNLSSIRNRLKPFFVFNLIKNPREIFPHSVMPRIPLPDKTLKLIVDFLFQKNEQLEKPSFLSLTEWPIILQKQEKNSTNTYLKHCALCHGNTGNGDGYNARFLPVKPTVHADSTYMSRRPDDTLFDGVYAGGYILNKSHLMPPWGLTLSPEEIDGLVAHIRELCKCTGPEWTSDNQISNQK